MMENHLITPQSEKNDWIEYSDYLSNSDLKAFFSYRTFPTNGTKGRKAFADAVGFNSERLILPEQTHSTNIYLNNSPGSIKNCDGSFSNDSSLICSIQVADCMPIYFGHRAQPLFGLIHAGWRGLVNGILKESKNLIEHLKFSVTDFDVIIGPSIQNCCFEVSDDVIGQFNLNFIEKKNNGKYRVNLQKSALFELENLGFRKEKINSSSICTFCSENKFHSYRRDGKKAGRMIGLFGLT